MIKPLMLLALTAFALQAHGKVDAVQAARLGQDLTPLGAERAGNTAGTIPQWNGGITTPPAGYSVGMHHLDPFAGDEVLFTINQQNLDQYRAQLPVGTQMLIEKTQIIMCKFTQLAVVLLRRSVFMTLPGKMLSVAS